MKNSVKSAANVVTAVPSNIMHSTYSMVGGIGKALTSGSTKDSNPQLADGKVGAGKKSLSQKKIALCSRNFQNVKLRLDFVEI